VDRRTDASKLSFPLQMVIFIVGTAVAVYTSQASIRTDQASIRSDVRDIITRLELGRDTAKAQAAAQDERLNALRASIDTTATTMKGSIDAIQRRQEMQQIQISELKEAILKLSQGRK
jgi:chaperonin cofactor prefoldin